jgi:glycosyltransferase involved in cell wall biosynthesis
MSPDTSYTSKMNPLISIVIPNYNSILFIAEALESALNQDYKNKEVIVVDDGSTDGSVEFLRTYEGKIRLIETENRGAAAARNTGLLTAKGELIALLDSDDIWTTNKLTLQFRKMVEEDADLVYCHGQEFGNLNGANLKRLAMYSGDCYLFFKRNPGKAIIHMGSSTSLFKRNLLAISGVFDTSFTGHAEDWDFFRRYSRIAKVSYCDEVLAMIRKHSNSISGRPLNDFYVGNRRAILKMFAEDFSIDVLARRKIWVKFHFMSAKAFIKQGNMIMGIRCLVRFVLPITH